MLARIASAIAFTLVGLAFLALIIFELRSGVAAAKFGATTLRDHPGTYSLFIATQAFFAAIMFAGATGLHLKSSPTLRRLSMIPFAIVLLLFIWTIGEIARDMLAAGAGMGLQDRWVFGGIGAMLLIVMGTIGYQLIWLEIRDSWLR